MLVRVKGIWLNPEMVVGVWYEHIEYADSDYWRVTMRCHEGQVWYFKHDNEEDAQRDMDKIADQINVTAHACNANCSPPMHFDYATGKDLR